LDGHVADAVLHAALGLVAVTNHGLAPVGHHKKCLQLGLNRLFDQIPRAPRRCKAVSESSWSETGRQALS